MLENITANKQIYITLLLWLIIGIASKTIALIIIPLHILLLNSDIKIITLYLGFWFLLILSDSYQHQLAFATFVKPFAAIAIVGVVYQNTHKIQNSGFYTPFIPFFAIASYCMFKSPIIFTSLQKQISYFFLLFAIPSIVNYLLNNYKELFLKQLVTLIAIILLLGVMLKYIQPNIVMFMGERFSGVFGNPNGMGMFGFLFFSLFTIIIYYYPNLFTKTERNLLYVLILISLIWSGSRGGLLSIAIFVLGAYLFKKSPIAGFLFITLLLVGFKFAISNFEAIVYSLELQNYFRIETLENGSGRDIAFDFAWENIQDNYWIGRGFGFGEYLMQQNQALFIKLGHVGNVHNSYLTIWLDTGLIGLILFVVAWLTQFYNALKYSFFAAALFFAVILSSSVESWLAASLNPFTIQLVTMLTLLTNKSFIFNEDNAKQ